MFPVSLLKFQTIKYLVYTADTSQLGSKLFIDEKVDKEVCQVVYVVREAEVAADWSTDVCYVYYWEK